MFGVSLLAVLEVLPISNGRGRNESRAITTAGKESMANSIQAAKDAPCLDIIPSWRLEIKCHVNHRFTAFRASMYCIPILGLKISKPKSEFLLPAFEASLVRPQPT
jgi:hypothetical protein